MRKFANSDAIAERRQLEDQQRAREQERELFKARLKPAGAVVNAELAALNVQRWRDANARRRAS